ncbi:uncharacterized protein LOC124444867 [Xenia sp. Carnegie-2017]|uniref:uncharacterized protein LOC124444867 n=1 Tax=Xenia sp. Carnegie-2017 TaxID=2897299 RepID=UPI001F045459|nr:uncharacterized protein LOC124444867 [Xenia sp. Carnegie-2017]
MSTRFQKAKVAGCFPLKENIKEIASIMVSLNCANIHACKWWKIDGFWAKVLEECGHPNLANSRKYLYMMGRRNWGGFQNAYESEQQRQTNIAKKLLALAFREVVCSHKRNGKRRCRKKLLYQVIRTYLLTQMTLHH